MRLIVEAVKWYLKIQYEQARGGVDYASGRVVARNIIGAFEKELDEVEAELGELLDLDKISIGAYTEVSNLHSYYMACLWEVFDKVHPWQAAK